MTDFELVRLAFHEVDASPGFAAWLADEGLSVGFTSGPRLFLAGLRDDGSLILTERQYGPCTALACLSDDTLFLATRFQIWRLENALPPGTRTDDAHDRQYVPQTAWTTGLLGVHDLALDGNERPVFVSSRFSCVGTVSERVNFEPQWIPPFVSALASEDRCHLTGLAMEDGRPAYVTCAATTDVPEGWRAHRRDGGVVVRVENGAIVATGLSIPHSPRLRDRRLWLANGGAGELGYVDLDRGSYEPVVALPGFTRGLAFHGRYALVGVSRAPRDDTFEGLVLGERLSRSGTEPACGVFVVDADTGEVAHSLVLHGAAPEIQDVAALPAVRSPAAVAIQGDDVQEIVTIPCPAP